MSCCSSSFSYYSVYFGLLQLAARGLREVLPQRHQAQRAAPGAVVPQCPGKGASSLSELETFNRGVQMRSTSRCGATWIGYDGRAVRVRSCDHPQQLTLGDPLSTTDARPDGYSGVG
jgi:hypothetical protein